MHSIQTSTNSDTRPYRFETKKSFQYPVLRQYEHAIYVAVTQSDTLDGKTGYIAFGKLEEIADHR